MIHWHGLLYHLIHTFSLRAGTVEKSDKCESYFPFYSAVSFEANDKKHTIDETTILKDFQSNSHDEKRQSMEVWRYASHH